MYYKEIKTKQMKYKGKQEHYLGVKGPSFTIFCLV